MYYIRPINLFFRIGRMYFNTSKNINVKSLKPIPSESPKIIESSEQSLDNQQYISPLYTQKVGLFTKPGVLFKDDVNTKKKAYVLYALSIISFVVVVSMIKIVPPGHVGIVTRKNGKIDQFNNKGRLALFHIPFIEKPVAFRITPIRKKIVRTCLTADSKQLEVVIFLTLTAKAAFASHIYSIFGVNYTREFVEKELNFDIDQVIKKFKLNDLTLSTESVENLENKKGNLYSLNSPIDQANEEMIQRFEDAGLFNKIEVSDVIISYRRPDLSNIPV